MHVDDLIYRVCVCNEGISTSSSIKYTTYAKWKDALDDLFCASFIFI